jgi:hypothetical protein
MAAMVRRQRYAPSPTRCAQSSRKRGWRSRDWLVSVIRLLCQHPVDCGSGHAQVLRRWWKRSRHYRASAEPRRISSHRAPWAVRCAARVPDAPPSKLPAAPGQVQVQAQQGWPGHRRPFGPSRWRCQSPRVTTSGQCRADPVVRQTASQTSPIIIPVTRSSWITRPASCPSASHTRMSLK